MQILLLIFWGFFFAFPCLTEKPALGKQQHRTRVPLVLQNSAVRLPTSARSSRGTEPESSMPGSDQAGVAAVKVGVDAGCVSHWSSHGAEARL